MHYRKTQWFGPHPIMPNQHCQQLNEYSVFANWKTEKTKYTVNHKKRATLFLIITPAFLGRFLQFLYQ